jgi:hypothetical protein
MTPAQLEDIIDTIAAGLASASSIARAAGRRAVEESRVGP